MKIYLISYGDDKYKSQRDFFLETAIASSFFDEIKIFSRKDIEPEYILEIGERLQRPRGAGYWLWKPYFVKKTLEEMKDGDILVYCDAGCMINGEGRVRFEEYVNLLIASSTGTLDFELPLKELVWTKQEIFDEFDSSDEIINSNQLVGTVLLLRKCTKVNQLVEEWYGTACNHTYLFTDELNPSAQHKDFIENRHDQSIFSVIRKTRGANAIPDETYFLDFIREGQPYPFWATRLKG